MQILSKKWGYIYALRENKKQKKQKQKQKCIAGQDFYTCPIFGSRVGKFPWKMMEVKATTEL